MKSVFCWSFVPIAWALALLESSTSLAPPPDCVSYRDTVIVHGTLERLTFPGWPNYESVAAGDEAETGYYIRLQDPICACPGAGQSPDSDATVEPKDSVLLIQLVLDSTGYALFRPVLGKYSDPVLVHSTSSSALPVALAREWTWAFNPGRAVTHRGESRPRLVSASPVC
jgi:hypothetical protein